MSAQSFPRDRYDPVQFELAFASAEIIQKRGEIYATLLIDDEEIEIHFPLLEALPLPPELRLAAERACGRINALDNSVQAFCENEAKYSQFDESNYKLRIAYLKVYGDRLQVRYWGEIVNTELEALFHWNAAANAWNSANF